MYDGCEKRAVGVAVGQSAAQAKLLKVDDYGWRAGRMSRGFFSGSALIRCLLVGLDEPVPCRSRP